MFGKRTCYKKYLSDSTQQVPRETRRRQRRLLDLDSAVNRTVDNATNEHPAHVTHDGDGQQQPRLQSSLLGDTVSGNDWEYVPDGNELLSEIANVSRGQLFSLLFAYILKHCLTQAAISDLIALFNTVLPGCLPPNLYFFNKITDINDTLQTCLYCSNCETFLGKYDEKSTQIICPDCNILMDASSLIKNGCFFLLYPLEKSLRELLQLHGVGQLLLSCGNSISDQSCVIADICDGSQYSGNSTASLSLTANIDGVPVFKSSNKSLWPVYYTVSNLPLADRRSHIVLHGLWFGVHKPNMNCFLTPITDDLVKVNRCGLTWSSPSGSTVRTTVNLDLVVADSVARPLLQNFKQFNGKYGCGFCLQEGTLADKGQGSVRTYPAQSSLPQLHTHEQSLQFAEEAQQSGTDVFGVKGVSALYLVPGFNIVTGFNPEYMHCVLLGVVRQLVNLWFDSSSHGKAYSIRHRLSDVDSVILNTKPPSEIKRLPRSLTLRAYWKASEWRSFLLFYSVVALKTVLPQRFYTHWLLLAFSVYSLLSKRISHADLLACDLALHDFVICVLKLYGSEHVSFNVHLLTPLVASVQQWGPLWASSAFIFEDANRKLLRWFHGSNAVSRQIFKSYVAHQHLQPLAERYIRETSDSAICQLFSRLSQLKVLCANGMRFADGVVGVGGT